MHSTLAANRVQRRSKDLALYLNLELKVSSLVNMQQVPTERFLGGPQALPGLHGIQVCLVLTPETSLTAINPGNPKPDHSADETSQPCI